MFLLNYIKFYLPNIHKYNLSQVYKTIKIKYYKEKISK